MAYFCIRASYKVESTGDMVVWINRTHLGFCEPFGGLTSELSDLGFGHCDFAYMPLFVGGMHWRHDSVGQVASDILRRGG